MANEYAITEDEANVRVWQNEEVYVVWVGGGVPNFFNDIDGAFDFADEHEGAIVLDYATGNYAS